MILPPARKGAGKTWVLRGLSAAEVELTRGIQGGLVALNFPRAKIDGGTDGRTCCASGLVSGAGESIFMAEPGMVRQGSARPGWATRVIPTARGAIFGAMHGNARLGRARHGRARRCEAGLGAANTSPGTVIPDNFPSTKKRPHHAGQRSTG